MTRSQKIFFYAVGGLALVSTSTLAQPKPHVEILAPHEPLAIGSYGPLKVRVIPASAISQRDIEVVLPEGRAAGTTSLSTVGGKLSRRLCAGSTPGSHTLVARRISNGAVLAKAHFTITATWRERDLGPSLCVLQASMSSSNQFAWGGGPSGPENFPVTPQTGPKPVAVIFVDTSDSRFPSDISALRNSWASEFGAAPPASSVNGFYNEVSYGQLLESAQFFGPISLDGAWADYFEQDTGVWIPIGNNMASEVIAKADALIDYSKFKTVLFATASISNPQFVWPNTWDAYIDTQDGEQHFGLTAMASDWNTMSPDGRNVHDTVSHELGHTLGLSDQYTYDGEDPSSAQREPLGWDPMDFEAGLPYFSIGHRIVEGWLNPASIKSYNFSEGVVPAIGGDTITLAPIEAGPAPAGEFSGIEVRIADGWNYYFEYRKTQANQSGDQALPHDGVVVGYDFLSYGASTPLARRQVELLPSGASYKDGPVLALNQTFQETDPTFPADLDVKVVDLAADHATVNIQYGSNGHSDPAIRPWGGDADHQWQSPDIEVRNARNGQGDPTSDWYNVPWTGHDNTIVAKIRNNGDADAPQVRVRFSLFDFSMGGVPPTFVLGEVVNDVPKGGSPVEFKIPWIPSQSDHICILAQIELYQDPNTGLVEKTELNNVAQSNYSHFISASASPYSREGTGVMVRNPTNKPAFFFFIPSQTNPLYRSYLDHSWIRLPAGATQTINAASEYAGADIEREMNESHDPAERNALSRLLEVYRFKPNLFSVEARMRQIGSRDASLVRLGGAAFRIDQGLASKVEINARGTVLAGAVTLAHGGPAPTGTVILSVKRRAQSSSSPPSDTTLRAVASSFRFRLPLDWSQVSAYFVGQRGTADSTSRTITR